MWLWSVQLEKALYKANITSEWFPKHDRELTRLLQQLQVTKRPTLSEMFLTPSFVNTKKH